MGLTPLPLWMSPAMAHQVLERDRRSGWHRWFLLGETVQKWRISHKSMTLITLLKYFALHTTEVVVLPQTNPRRLRLPLPHPSGLSSGCAARSVAQGWGVAEVEPGPL